MPSALLFQWPGALGASALGAALALLGARVMLRRDARPWATALTTLPLAFPLLDLLGGGDAPWRGPALLAGGLLLALLLAFRDRIPPAAEPWLVALPTLGLYLATLSPYVGRADTFEFQVTALRLGVAHPTGYPLYILLGRLFSLLPFGTLAWKVNLTSAVFATGAVTLTYLLVKRLTRLAGSAALTALALAWSATLWSQAVIAEVYALNLLFVAGALWLALDLLDGKGLPRTLWIAALLLGLSLTNHLTMALLLPALGLACLLRRPRLRLSAWLKAAGLFALGLAVYAYIPLRWPALHNGQWIGAGEFLAYITGRQFGGALQLGLLRDPTRYGILLRLLREPFGAVGLGLAALGLARLTLTRWRVALFTLAAFIPYCLYGLAYLVPDLEVFIIPAHLLLALWIGLGIAALSAGTPRLAPWLPRLILILSALLPLSLLWKNLPTGNLQAVGRADEAWGRYVLTLPLAENAAILADSEKYPPLYYLQQAEGLRPDLELVMRYDEAGYQEELQARLAAGQRVYVARYLPGLDAYGVSAAGPLVEVAPPDAAPPEGEPEARFAGGLALLDHALEADPEGRRLHHLTLDWQPTAPLTQDLSVRLRLVTPDGAVAWAGEGSRPVSGYSTTQAWRPGQRIADYHAPAWPDWLPGGDYRLDVALGPRFSEAQLTPGWVALETLTLPWASVAPPETPRRARFGGTSGALWVEGLDLPGEAGAESPVSLTLTGIHLGDLPENVRAQFYWLPLDNEHWEPPVMPAGLPASAWPVGQRVQQRYVIPAPRLPGHYRLALSWLAAGEPLPAQCAWLADATTQCILGDITIGPSTVGLANFDGQIVLVDATWGAEPPTPGAALPLTLRWRSLRALSADYTVFAQVVGPDGKLYGQLDSWPVQGTYPTSRWVSGEEVVDPYQVHFAADAPPGEYQVIVGWYLLGTMERLAVRDASGQALGDYYVVGSFTID